MQFVIIVIMLGSQSFSVLVLLRNHDAKSSLYRCMLNNPLSLFESATFGPLARYVKLWVAHAPGIRERFPDTPG